MNDNVNIIKEKIFDLTKEYYKVAFPSSVFIPGKSKIPYAGRIFDSDELLNLVESSLDFWLTSGRFAERFEIEFAQFFNSKHAILVNSGSSANLISLSCLTAIELGERRLNPGDEVITTAMGFPTTINPIIQTGLIPAFIDVTIPTYNADVTQLEEALNERTKAIILAHTLGNPFDLNSVISFAQRHNLWVIEDCCDAVGSKYKGQGVGTFGDLATVSFYPAHHMTMGEGGSVLTNNSNLYDLARSFRDWGRDCTCDPGKDNTCGNRFSKQMGELPYGYDHKYIYSQIGYNLKVTDMQAAVGLAQLKKLPSFIESRKRNFGLLLGGLRDMEDIFILPQATPDSEPSWFGFPLAIRQKIKFNRHQIVQYLEKHKIATRLLFGGNLTRQPAYCNNNVRYRKIGSLVNSDFVMNNVFWIGVYPGLSTEMIEYILECFHSIRKDL